MRAPRLSARVARVEEPRPPLVAPSPRERYSGASPLVILTLPQRHPEQPQAEWLISIDTLVASLQRVIFIQESGKEQVQFYK